MKFFEDARQLVAHCERNLPAIQEAHSWCLKEQTIEPGFLVDVKNFMENLRSALDYCAAALFTKYGKSKQAKPKIYFPCAGPGESRDDFREKTIERCIPGLLGTRPDVVDRLEEYQYFGDSGNWLPILARLTNENKHTRLTPQVAKQYKAVEITATIPPGQSIEIDLKRIPLGGGPGAPFHAMAGTWTGLEFADSGVVLMPFLAGTLPNVRRVVDELSKV